MKEFLHKEIISTQNKIHGWIKCRNSQTRCTIPGNDADVMSSYFWNGIGAQGMEFGFFIDRQIIYPAIHFTGGGLVKPDRRIDQPDRLQDVQHRIDIELNGANGLLEW